MTFDKVFKKKENDELMTFEQFIDEFSKKYHISVEFNKNGTIYCFIGSERGTYEQKGEN